LYNSERIVDAVAQFIHEDQPLICQALHLLFCALDLGYIGKRRDRAAHRAARIENGHGISAHRQLPTIERLHIDLVFVLQLASSGGALQREFLAQKARAIAFMPYGNSATFRGSLREVLGLRYT